MKKLYTLLFLFAAITAGANSTAIVHQQTFVAQSTFSDAAVGPRNKVYYRLQVTNKNGQTTSTNTLIIDLQSNQEITVYPTLFAGTRTVQNYLIGVQLLQLYNVDCAIQHHQLLRPGAKITNSANVPKGTYLYKIMACQHKTVASL